MEKNWGLFRRSALITKARDLAFLAVEDDARLKDADWARDVSLQAGQMLKKCIHMVLCTTILNGVIFWWMSSIVCM